MARPSGGEPSEITRTPAASISAIRSATSGAVVGVAVFQEKSQSIVLYDNRKRYGAAGQSAAPSSADSSS